MASNTLTGRVATMADFDKLAPLLQNNCQRMQFDWAKYEFGTRQILSNPDYGFIILAEKEDGSAAGFLSLTFEWSDWRNGVFFWMQGLELDAACDQASVISTLKAALELHKTTLDFQCCGIRLCTPKVVHHEVETAIQAFDLKPSHYYIYHIDTA